MSAKSRVAAAVRKHREELHEEGICCCGWHANTEMDYPAHLAAEVWMALTDALQLTEEWGVITDMGVEAHGWPRERALEAVAKWPDMSARSRLVSPWMPVLP